MKVFPSYQNLMVIVHGKSEYAICKNIGSNLRLSQEVIARDKGEHSIQITSVLSVLRDKRFYDVAGFQKAFPKVLCQKGKLVKFQLFVIMDTDDCTEKQKQDYISGNMFREHWLYPYIVPIFNSPNLEQTMKEAKIPVTKKKDYVVLFPTSHGDLDVKKAKDLLKKLEACRCTNMGVYIRRCVELAEYRANM